MGETTKIEWCDHTFNPWRGCTKIAEGRKFCYADAQSKRKPKTLGIWGSDGTRVMASAEMWRQPVKWNKAAERDGVRRRVFCASLADVFEDWQGAISGPDGCELFVEPNSGNVYATEIHEGCDRLSMQRLRSMLFSLIDATPHLDWLLLTKRPENIHRMWQRNNNPPGCPIEFQTGDIFKSAAAHFRFNVWLLTSVATQSDVDRNVPQLLKCRDLVPVLGLSCEPLLGPVNLSEFTGFDLASPAEQCAMREIWPHGLPANSLNAIYEDKLKASNAVNRWVIVGGESGPNARPCNIGWIRSIVRQCREAGVPCFAKQLGARPYMYGSDGERFRWPCGFEVKGDKTWLLLKDRKGGDPAEWPEDLRDARDFPRPATVA